MYESASWHIVSQFPTNELGYETQLSERSLRPFVERPTTQFDNCNSLSSCGGHRLLNERTPNAPSAKFQGDSYLINFAPLMRTTEYILGTFANNGGNIPNELPLFLGDPDVRRSALQECPELLHDFV